MAFDPDNRINQLCAQGMEMEGIGDTEKALQLFSQAWDEAVTDTERFTAAHYVARHQGNVPDKLKWDTEALSIALRIPDDEIKSSLPSLFLNVAKCHEDLGNISAARDSYTQALSFTAHLPQGGYADMIRAGIAKGLERIYKL